MTFILTQHLLPTAVKCNTIYVLFLNLAQYRGKHLWLLLSQLYAQIIQFLLLFLSIAVQQLEGQIQFQVGSWQGR